VTFAGSTYREQMRLATVRTPEGTRAARVEADHLELLSYRDVGSALESGNDLGIAPTSDDLALDTANFAPVVTDPSKVFCLGLNYRPHIEEMGHEIPEHPTLFPKFAAALCGAHDPIQLPPESTSVDSEAELVIVIGRTVRRADEAAAEAAIAGFAVGNDISMRDWQRHTTQFMAGKTWEASSPVGPLMATPDEVGGVRPALAIEGRIDDQTFQSANTGELIFDPIDCVRYISTIITLEPGDLIFTGTPGGVGAARTPPIFLQAGQTVVTTIEGIGELANNCVASS
jgi:acylpyruvate hydrolase